MPSNLIEQSLPAASGINIVLATGCPGSGWETVIPALQAGGLEPGDNRFSLLYEQLDRHGIPAAEALPAPEALPGENPLLLADQRNLQILDFQATQLPHARFLLFYQTAETALAHALLNDHRDPLRFLHDWQTTNRQLINFQRRHRDRAILLNAEAAGRHPQGLFDACARIGLKLESSGRIETVPPAIPATERLLADYLVRQHPAIPPFQAELEARAQPFDTPLPDKDQQIALLINDYLRETGTHAEHRQQFVELTGKLQAIEQSAGRQTDQIRKLTEERDQLRKEKDTLAAEKQALQKNLEQDRQAQAHHDELEKENELLLLQLHQVQEELEDYYLKYQDLVQQQPALPSPAPVETVEEPRTTAPSKPDETTPSFLAKLTAFFKQRNALKDTRQQRRLILESGLFDTNWYLSSYPDVAKAKADPILHYIRHGARERRNPSPHFDTAYYLHAYADVAKSGMNPLFHYIRFGKKEGRRPA